MGLEVKGVGTDVVEIERVAGVFRRRVGFMRRVYSEDEIAYCLGESGPLNNLAYQRLAVRWAAKEAVLKALGCGLGACRLKDISIVPDGSGRPQVELKETAVELAKSKGVTSLLISLSHSDVSAQAFVIAQG